MALRGDDKGEIKGPGIMREMESRLIVEGRSCGAGPGGGRLGCPEGDGSGPRASDGRRGVDSVVSESLGRKGEWKMSSVDNRQGLLRSGD